MRVLAFDPGATRCGYAVVENDPLKYVTSGVIEVQRGSEEKYQPYKLRLIEFWVKQINSLLDSYDPSSVVNELVPVVGGQNFVIATQSQLAGTVATVINAIAVERNYDFKQVSAVSVKKRIAGTPKATKPKVRDGVYALLPSAVKDKPTFDETDALAVALFTLGYKNV